MQTINPLASYDGKCPHCGTISRVAAAEKGACPKCLLPVSTWPTYKNAKAAFCDRLSDIMDNAIEGKYSPDQMRALVHEAVTDNLPKVWELWA